MFVNLQVLSVEANSVISYDPDSIFYNKNTVIKYLKIYCTFSGSIYPHILLYF